MRVNARVLAGRAVICQMHLGPWPVVAPTEVWRWLERQGWVRAVPALGERPAGYMLCGAGCNELERLGWSGAGPPDVRVSDSVSAKSGGPAR